MKSGVTGSCFALSQKIKAGRAFRERDSLAKAFGKVAVKSIV